MEAVADALGRSDDAVDLVRHVFEDGVAGGGGGAEDGTVAGAEGGHLRRHGAPEPGAGRR